MKGLRAKFNTLSLSELGSGLRALQVASAQRAVLDNLTVSLVLFDQVLIDTATGAYRTLAQPSAELDLYSRVAQAARLLLEGQGQTHRILLLLPPSQFVATPYTLNVGSEKLLRSALTLQAHSLIPAFDQPLMLGVSGGQGTGVALWYPVPQTRMLFERFQEQGLLLGAIMPRNLAQVAMEPQAMEATQCVLDVDATHQTFLQTENGSIRHLYTASKRDLEQDVFIQQWNQVTSQTAHCAVREFSTLAHWSELRQQIPALRAYTYIPQSAEASGRQKIRQKQQKQGALAAAVLVLLLCLPFISNAVQKTMLRAELEEYQELSATARENQASVIELEAAWGAIADYPRQDVGQVLLILNSFIDSALSSFTINKGVVDISGFAQDPALLIEQLSEREEFYEVGQSRSSSAGNSGSRGDRFGIRLNLSDVDFPGYEAQYPVTQ